MVSCVFVLEIAVYDRCVDDVTEARDKCDIT